MKCNNQILQIKASATIFNGHASMHYDLKASDCSAMKMKGLKNTWKMLYISNQELSNSNNYLWITLYNVAISMDWADKF